MKRYLALFLVLLAACAWAGQTRELTILHTNDLHGMLLPFDHLLGKDRGGLARRATAIKEIRAESADRPVILLEGGDIFTRGPWHTRFYGEPEVDALNLLRYDVACIGNNEFKAKDGTESQGMLLGLIKRSTFPWLAANLTVTATGQPPEGVKPYVIQTFGDLKIGFLGVTSPKAIAYPQTVGWTISDPIATAKKVAPELRKQCDLLVALTHIGYDPLDRQLAAEVPGIDVIVGADSHTFLPAPEFVAGPDGRRVPIVQAGEMGIMLGRLDLVVEQTEAGWRVNKAAGKLLPINNTYKDDPDMKALLDRYLAPPVAWWLPARAWVPG